MDKFIVLCKECKKEALENGNMQRYILEGKIMKKKTYCFHAFMSCSA